MALPGCGDLRRGAPAVAARPVPGGARPERSAALQTAFRDQRRGLLRPGRDRVVRGALALRLHGRAQAAHEKSVALRRLQPGGRRLAGPPTLPLLPRARAQRKSVPPAASGRVASYGINRPLAAGAGSDKRLFENPLSTPLRLKFSLCASSV